MTRVLMTSTSVSPAAKLPLTQRLLSRAHSPDTAASLYTDKIQHKPLLLRPATAQAKASFTDARTHRQHVRKVKEAQSRRRKQKPRPLSAKEKRSLDVYSIPKEERKWEIYEGLWKMWCGYMREILNIPTSLSGSATGQAQAGDQSSQRLVHLTGATAGPMLGSADFHGARICCVRSRCSGRVGTEGVVVRDTKFTFVVITKKNEIKILPKEHSVFRFEVPLSDVVDDGGMAQAQKTDNKHSLVFELHGEQFKNRAVDRANKKFKVHIPPDL